MRIHGNTLSAADVFTAASMAGVVVDDVTRHGSRSRAHAFDVYVFGSSAHRPNNRDHGSDQYAATWDEWGIFLAELFRRDSSLTVPRVYADAGDFHFQTADRFDGRAFDAHRQHRFTWQGTDGEQKCTCGAVRRWRV